MERHLPPVVQGDCGKQCGKQAIMPPREGGMRDSELRAGEKTQRARRDSWCSLANTTTWTTESARICEMKSSGYPFHSAYPNRLCDWFGRLDHPVIGCGRRAHGLLH